MSFGGRKKLLSTIVIKNASVYFLNFPWARAWAMPYTLACNTFAPDMELRTSRPKQQETWTILPGGSGFCSKVECPGLHVPCPVQSHWFQMCKLQASVLSQSSSGSSRANMKHDIRLCCLHSLHTVSLNLLVILWLTQYPFNKCLFCS